MIVSVLELETYMDIHFTNRQKDAAELVLEGLQAELEAYLGRPIEIDIFIEEIRLDSNHVGIPMTSFFYNTSLDTTMSPVTYAQPPQTIYLRWSPVVHVEEVTLTPLFNTAQVLEVERDYVVRPYGIDCFRGYANELITVTYSAGLAENRGLKVFKLMILRAATREMQNMHDDVVGVKDLEARNVASLETGFLEKELLAVKKYRRVRIS